jgi:hypothetical protein
VDSVRNNIKVGHKEVRCEDAHWVYGCTKFPEKALIHPCMCVRACVLVRDGPYYFSNLAGAFVLCSSMSVNFVCS